jgi:hypothetical protein
MFWACFLAKINLYPWLQRVNLNAMGYFETTKVDFNPQTNTGTRCQFDKSVSAVFTDKTKSGQ